MNEQTILNAEQEAFLAYQAASEAHKQHGEHERLLWENYMRLGQEANTAFNKWKAYREKKNDLFDAEINSLKKWHGLRKY